jgi:23S rRNA pseudouridine1911/1915/1917 synthase
VTDTKSPHTRPLLDWLAEKFPDTPRKRAKQWILAGRVRVDGRVVRKPHDRLAAPGQIELLAERQVALACQPAWPIHPQLALLYLDASLAIVNKAPGLLSTPTPHERRSALTVLADFLSGKLWAGKYSVPPGFRTLRPLPVHRLDQYTSGVLCIALNPKARAHLIEQFNRHTITRQYLAWVAGRPRASRGTWRHWLRLSENGLRQEIVPKRLDKLTVEAVTHYEVLAEFAVRGGAQPVSKLRLRLETGRKHQIRVQAAHEGVPLLGDRVYNPRRGPVAFSRHALHAELLALDHPEQPGKRLAWNAPLPDDLRKLEAACQRDAKLVVHP